MKIGGRDLTLVGIYFLGFFFGIVAFVNAPGVVAELTEIRLLVFWLFSIFYAGFNLLWMFLAYTFEVPARHIGDLSPRGIVAFNHVYNYGLFYLVDLGLFIGIFLIAGPSEALISVILFFTALAFGRVLLLFFLGLLESGFQVPEHFGYRWLLLLGLVLTPVVISVGRYMGQIPVRGSGVPVVLSLFALSQIVMLA